MKHFLFLLLLLQITSAYSQTKKKQIALLISTNDSLSMQINSEREVSASKIAALEQSLEKEKANNLSIQKTTLTLENKNLILSSEVDYFRQKYENLLKINDSLLHANDSIKRIKTVYSPEVQKHSNGEKRVMPKLSRQTPQNASTVPSNQIQYDNGEDADIVAKALERRQKELDRQKQGQDRLAQQEAERKRLLAEERQKQMDEARKRAATDMKNQKGGQGGNGPGGQGTAGSQGIAGGQGNQGNPNGNPNSNNFNGDGSGSGAAGTGMGNVAGRQYRGGPSLETNIEVEGVVTVKIWVDNDGKVLRVRGGVPLTTITDRNIWKLCENNAKQHIFSANPNDEAEKEGTITYRFKLQ